MRRLLCCLLGHRADPARSIGPLIRPDVGLVHGWEKCSPSESRGMGCTRCGLYQEHPWVTIERARLGRQP